MSVSKPDELTEEAAEWFARLQRETVSAQDALAFEAWVEGHPARAVAFARIEATWERAERLRAGAQAYRPTVSPRMDQRMTRRAAAGIVGLVGLGATAAAIAWRPEQRYGTALGQRRAVTLADGSRVVLNTDSSLSVAYSRGRRDVRLLAGEALFEVAPDPARPFVVTAGEASVRAVGTAFNVRLRGALAEVTVTEGVVAISDRAPRLRRESPAHIRAGAAAVAGAGAVAEVTLDDEALQARTAWREGLIELRGETLEAAAAEFNRYSDRKLMISDPKLSALRVGGAFGTQEVDKFVAALEAGFPVRAVAGSDGAIWLVPAP